jgi:dihydroflavonol-4-reductase
MRVERLAVVTGASGYIAKHIVAQLLDEGWHVRGTVRQPDRGEEVRAAVRPVLRDPRDLSERLSFATLDLERDEGWDEALAGADALVHTASPFPLVQPKDPDAVIRPAVSGMRRALEAAARAGVRRVVATSSVAAIMEGPLPPGRAVRDERDWTDPDTPGATPYVRSKTLAERAAWEVAEARGLALTTINPGFVIGPGLDRRIGTSLSVVQRLLQGRDPMLPNFGFSCVDVRDVAAMHVAALDRPEAAGERIIGAERFLWFPEMGAILKAEYPDRRITTRTAPKLVVRLLALFDPAVRSILPDLGRRREARSDKAARLLGVQFRDARQSLKDAAAFLVREGLA